MTDEIALLHAYGCFCRPTVLVRRGFYIGCATCSASYRADAKGGVDVNPPVAGTGAACHYCKKRPAVLTRDHIVPRSLGGPDRRTNIVMACEPCNRRKANLRSTCGCAKCRVAWVNFGPGHVEPTWSPKC